ncbi:MAG: NYN domain-containing protein [Deltaproteobacteria bacterium]|nr:NYN domain-containing protein [Deltaproteobacteria bacterium]
MFHNLGENNGQTASPFFRTAVLIDADNASVLGIKNLFKFITQRIGEPYVRRLYGDFSVNMNFKWRDLIRDLALQPVQQFAFLSHKNVTDFTLIMDAIDLSHSNLIDSFCIVSSDSDFTGLVIRLRESGFKVYGFGEPTKTSDVFRRACYKFLYTEQFRFGVPDFEKAPELQFNNASVSLPAISFKSEYSSDEALVDDILAESSDLETIDAEFIDDEFIDTELIDPSEIAPDQIGPDLIPNDSITNDLIATELIANDLSFNGPLARDVIDTKNNDNTPLDKDKDKDPINNSPRPETNAANNGKKSTSNSSTSTILAYIKQTGGDNIRLSSDFFDLPLEQIDISPEVSSPVINGIKKKYLIIDNIKKFLGDEWVPLATIGSKLYAQNPNIKFTEYGYKNLSSLINNNRQFFKVKMTDKNVIYIKLANQ